MKTLRNKRASIVHLIQNKFTPNCNVIQIYWRSSKYFNYDMQSAIPLKNVLWGYPFRDVFQIICLQPLPSSSSTPPPWQTSGVAGDCAGATLRVQLLEPQVYSHRYAWCPRRRTWPDPPRSADVEDGGGRINHTPRTSKIGQETGGKKQGKKIGGGRIINARERGLVQSTRLWGSWHTSAKSTISRMRLFLN